MNMIKAINYANTISDELGIKGKGYNVTCCYLHLVTQAIQNPQKADKTLKRIQRAKE